MGQNAQVLERYITIFIPCKIKVDVLIRIADLLEGELSFSLQCTNCVQGLETVETRLYFQEKHASKKPTSTVPPVQVGVKKQYCVVFSF